MQQLLAQKVQGDHLLPARPEGDHAGACSRRRARACPVIAIDATFGNPKPPRRTPGIATQVWQGRDIMAFLQVQALAKAAARSAKVGLIGIGAPVPALKYLNQREAFYAQEGAA